MSDVVEVEDKERAFCLSAEEYDFLCNVARDRGCKPHDILTLILGNAKRMYEDGSQQ